MWSLAFVTFTVFELRKIFRASSKNHLPSAPPPPFPTALIGLKYLAALAPYQKHP